MFLSVTLTPAIVALAAGYLPRADDLLVAFTDGVTEAVNAEGEDFGEERLKDLLTESIGAPAEEVAAKLSGRMRQWGAGAEQHDDLTFVAVAVR